MMSGTVFLPLSIVWGMTLGLLIQVFSALTRRLNRRWATAVLTIVTAVLLLAATALFLLCWNSGELSFYSGLAMAIGYLLYRGQLEKPVSRLAANLASGAQRRGRPLYRLALISLNLLLKPTAALVGILEKLFAVKPNSKAVNAEYEEYSYDSNANE